MRKALVSLLIIALVVGLATFAAMVYARHDNADRVKRAQEIVHELQRLEIGKSDHAVADVIATKFGNAPPPDGRDYYKENCAAPNHIESCTYFISMNDSPVETVLLKHQSLPRLGVREWFGHAQITFASGTVAQYSFWVWYKASNGRWRGFGTSERQSLPRFEPAQAQISDSYSVRRINMNHESRENGVGLESVLTPAATTIERQRASHIDFACLAGGHGFGEVCEVMPEAWRDFYEMRGRFDMEKLGLAYLLCSESPK
jgi:hypothetical protein